MNNHEDPRTLEAIAKIRAILTEYDLWGSVSVCSAERSHWYYHWVPSWSCLYYDPNTGYCRIRAIGADFKSAEGHKYVLDQTIGAIFATRDYATMLFLHADKMVKLLEQNFNIEHRPFEDVQFIPK